MLRKKLLIGVLALAFVLVVGVSTADAYSTLRLGSKGADVVTLQTKLGGLTADGSFGNLTLAAVKAFQTNKGLTADGVVGSMTWAALMSGTTTTTTGNLPAGCTSTTGYSSLTGAKCDGSTTGGTDNGPLTGGAGDLEITTTSTDVENEVIEGTNEKVLGFKIEAMDSDVLVKNLKLTLENTDTDGSYRIADYVDNVEIYMGSTKVGSVDASDFSKDGHVYSKSVTLNNVVVREGSSKKATFYVVVNAISNIDGDDIGQNSWDLEVDNIRFQDATGVIMTSDDSSLPLTETFTFTDLSTSGDVDLKVTKGSSSPVATNVEVSDTGSTKDVLMLEFKLKATGSDLSFDSIDFDLDGTIAGVNDLQDLLGELVLKNGSNELATVSTFAAADDETGVTFDLDDTYTIDEDSTDTFRVHAQVNDIDNYSQGDSLLVEFADIAAEDVNGDVVTETGSANGEAQSFYTEGISVDVKSATTTVTAGDLFTDTVEFAWSLDITAFGDNDIYINKDVLDIVASETAGDVDVVYLIEKSGGADLASVGGTMTESDSDVSSVTADAGAYGAAYNGEEFFKIDAGQTGTFTINLSGTNQTNSKQMRALLTAIEWTTDIVDATTLDAETATINSYSSNLDEESATPFKIVS